jgi:hypothetical protein
MNTNDNIVVYSKNAQGGAIQVVLDKNGTLLYYIDNGMIMKYNRLGVLYTAGIVGF